MLSSVGAARPAEAVQDSGLGLPHDGGVGELLGVPVPRTRRSRASVLPFGSGGIGSHRPVRAPEQILPPATPSQVWAVNAL